MNKFKKKYRAIYNYYKKELNKQHKFDADNFYSNLDYFVTYLRFMRDYYMLMTDDALNEDSQLGIKVSALVMALSEYEKYKTCINDYYIINNNRAVEQLDKTKTRDEIAADYAKEKLFHWHSFWYLVELNMEGWMADARF